MTDHTPRTPALGRHLAKHMLTDVRSGHSERVRKVAERIAAVPADKPITVADIARDPRTVKLKHCLNTLAWEWAGVPSWPDYVRRYDASADDQPGEAFTWTDLWGNEDKIPYDRDHASQPVFIGEISGDSVPAERERGHLEMVEVRISHKRDQAARSGTTYELTDFEREVLARLHWLDENAPQEYPAGEVWFRVSEIEWDTEVDGTIQDVDLPREMTVAVHIEEGDSAYTVEETVVNAVSDKTGWCVLSSSIDMLDGPTPSTEHGPDPDETLTTRYRVLDWDRLRDFFVDYEMQTPSEVARTLAESSWDEDIDEARYGDHEFLRAELREIYDNMLQSDVLLRIQDWGLEEELFEKGILLPADSQEPITVHEVFERGAAIDDWTCDVDPETGMPAPDAGQENLIELGDRHYLVISSWDGSIVLNADEPATPLPRLHPALPAEVKFAVIATAFGEFVDVGDDADYEGNLELDWRGRDTELGVIYRTPDGRKLDYDVHVDDADDSVVGFTLVDVR